MQEKCNNRLFESFNQIDYQKRNSFNFIFWYFGKYILNKAIHILY